MTSRSRVLALLVLLTVVATACTSGGDDPPATPSDAAASAPAETDGAAPADTSEETGGASGADVPEILLVEGATVDVDQALLNATAVWIAEESGLSAMLQEELFLFQTSQTQDVVHLTFVQQHDQVSVRGALFTVHIREDGEVVGASTSLTETLPDGPGELELDLAEAVDIAEKAVPGTPSSSEGGPIWLEVGPQLRLGYEVFVNTTGPPASYSVVVDGLTGDVLVADVLGANEGAHRHDKQDVAHEQGAHAAATRVEVAQADIAQAGCQAPAPPSGCIFVVDPIFSSGDPSIDPAAANSQLVGVELRNLNDPADGNLVGRYAQVFGPQLGLYNDPDNVFGQGGRGGNDITFEAVNTYYWIDYTQGLLQSIGYDFHGDDPVDFVPIEPDFPDNAFYTFVEDRIHMGDAADGVREAEDAQGVIHEYGHALVQAAIPNISSPEGGAFHEGFADLVSVFTTLEFRNGDVGCLFHWAERGRCLRRIDGDGIYPQDLQFAVHTDGMLYTGAVWEVFERALAAETGLTPGDCQADGNPCDVVRDEIFGTALGSMPFLTPRLTLQDAADAFALADQTFYDGANADLIAEVFSSRGFPIGTGGTMVGTGVADGGGDGVPVSNDSLITVRVNHEYRGDLDLRLDVVTPDLTELCNSQLLSPDPQDAEDNVTAQFSLTGSQCEPFLPPSPSQIWIIRAADTLPEDVGSLFSASVVHQGVTYIAPGLPLPIPDADPAGVVAVIGLPIGDDSMSSTAPPPAGTGTTTGTIEITHTYVGDLSVQVGVIDAAAGDVLCRIDLVSPDPQNSSADLLLDGVDLSACEAFLPPSSSQPWVVRVVDNAGLDIGTIDQVVITGPDGVVYSAVGPVDIPDDELDGALLVVTG